MLEAKNYEAYDTCLFAFKIVRFVVYANGYLNGSRKLLLVVVILKG